MPHDRPEAGRLDPRAYPLCVSVATEESGVAGDHHISNIVLAAYYDQSRTALLRRLYTPQVRQGGLRPLLVETRVTYRAEVAHPGIVRVATAAGPVGRTSFTMLQAQFVGETCVGLCDSTFVNFGPAGPEPVTAAHRELLASLAWRAPAASES